MDKSEYTDAEGKIFCPLCKKANREDKVRKGPGEGWYRCYNCGWSSLGQAVDPVL